MKRIQIATSALLLTLLVGCGPGKESGGEPKAPATTPPTAEAPKTPTPAPATAPAATEAAAPAAVPAAPAAGMVRYDALPTGSLMKIEGDSTIHSWKMESSVVGGYVETDAKFPESGAEKTKAEAFTPVRSFKSGNKTMDNKMQDTMKETQFKKIEYKLTELKPKAGAAGQFESVGQLTIAGKTKTLTMTVTAEKVEGTKLKFTGSTSFKMSDYGVTPPQLTIAGVGLKTEDSITNSFEWVLAPKE